MTADIDTKHFFLHGKHLFPGKFAAVRQTDLELLLLLRCHHVKEGHLSCHRGLAVIGNLIHQLSVHLHKLFARATQIIKSSAFDEVFHGTTVHLPAAHTINKILQGFKTPILRTLLYQCIDHRTADTLDGRQSIADIFAGHGKSRISVIDIWRQHGNPHLTAHLDIFCHFCRVINHRCHQGSHKFHRIVIFQICSLVRHHRIRCCMGFVKGIFCKICHLIENLVGNFLGNTVCHTARHALFFIAVHKILTLSGHDIAFFLGHGTTYQITSSQCITCQIPHNLHDLLLINDTSIRRIQDRFQLRTVIHNGRRIIFTTDIGWDKIHRSRTIQGNSGNDIFQALWF